MDYESWYKRISQPFRGDAAARAVNIVDKALVYVIAIAYIGVLAWLAIEGDGRLARMVLVPMFTFALVTTVRQKVNAPRPYELHDIDPIIRKDSKGESFPSRHLASAVIISCALAWINPVWGAAGLVASIFIAATRLIGGVHFPRDMAAAFAIALACGLVGFITIP